MRGVQILRERFGRQSVHLVVLSAGYGLVPEDQPIAPYNLTFSAMGRREARAWAAALNAPQDVARAVSEHEAAVFCLGERYLDALGSIPRSDRARMFFFAKPGLRAAIEGAGCIHVSAGAAESRRFGAGFVALKGRLFEIFATGLSEAPVGRWESILSDASGDAFAATLGDGLRAAA